MVLLHFKLGHSPLQILGQNGQRLTRGSDFFHRRRLFFGCRRYILGFRRGFPAQISHNPDRLDNSLISFRHIRQRGRNFPDLGGHIADHGGDFAEVSAGGVHQFDPFVHVINSDIDGGDNITDAFVIFVNQSFDLLRRRRRLLRQLANFLGDHREPPALFSGPRRFNILGKITIRHDSKSFGRRLDRRGKLLAEIQGQSNR